MPESSLPNYAALSTHLRLLSPTGTDPRQEIEFVGAAQHAGNHDAILGSDFDRTRWITKPGPDLLFDVASELVGAPSKGT